MALKKANSKTKAKATTRKEIAAQATRRFGALVSEPTIRTARPQKLSVKSSFSLFLADFKAAHSK